MEWIWNFWELSGLSGDLRRWSTTECTMVNSGESPVSGFVWTPMPFVLQREEKGESFLVFRESEKKKWTLRGFLAFKPPPKMLRFAASRPVQDPRVFDWVVQPGHYPSVSTFPLFIVLPLLFIHLFIFCLFYSVSPFA